MLCNYRGCKCEVGELHHHYHQGGEEEGQLHMQHVQRLLRVSVVRGIVVRTSTSCPTLTLYTKEECCLCEQAKSELKPFLDQKLVTLEEVDITKDPHLFGLYRYEIPVFYLDKKFLCKNKIDLEKLKQMLQKKSVIK